MGTMLRFSLPVLIFTWDFLFSDNIPIYNKICLSNAFFVENKGREKEIKTG